MSVRFPDPQVAARDLIRSVLAGRAEPEAQGAFVGTRVPGTTGDDLPALPYVLVRVDGASRTAQLDKAAIIRVTIWHVDEGAAMALAELVEALAVGSASAQVRSVQPLASPIATTDPDTGSPLAFLRFTAHLRPSNL